MNIIIEVTFPDGNALVNIAEFTGNSLLDAPVFVTALERVKEVSLKYIETGEGPDPAEDQRLIGKIAPVGNA